MTAQATRAAAGLARIAWLGPLLAIEIALIGALHQFAFDAECRELAAGALCAEARKLPARGAAVLAVAALYALARRDRLAALFERPPRGAALTQALSIHAVGVALMLLPWAIAPGLSSAGALALAAGPWALGAALAAGGALAATAPPAAWARWFAQDSRAAAAALVVGFLAPDLVALADAVWRAPALSDATFAAVLWTLNALGRDVLAEPALYLLKIDRFVVSIGPECSGVQGMALIALFSVLHLGLARRSLRFPHALVLPAAAIGLSWVFNVARLSALAIIGADVSPRLAVEGFHSQAGWIAFSVLAVMVMAASTLRPLRATAGAPPPPWRQDRAAAEIAPFAMTLFAAMAATATATPGLLAPVVAAIGAATLLAFADPLRAELRAPDRMAVAAGLAAGALWAATASAPTTDDAALTAAVAALGPAAGLWTVLRFLGAAAVTPIVEELFFRGYLARRIDPGGRGGPWIAAIAGAALFAVLHERWAAAFLVGLLFAGLRLRRRALIDAVAAHAACNAVVAAGAGWSAL